MKRQESSENYLETIYVLKNKNGTVRSIDIANDMGFSKASVSVAMKILREKKLISFSDENFIELTQEGLENAKKVYERHIIITKALTLLGVSFENANNDACRIEHDISDETFEKIKLHIVKYNN